MHNSQWKLGLSLLPFALVLAAAFADLSPAHSAPQSQTFIVKDTGDFADANPADGQCISTENSCTLRAAIQQANALYLSAGGVYTIVLPPKIQDNTPATYSLSIGDSGGAEDNASAGDLDIRCNLTIVSSDITKPSTIDASNINDRVFQIFQPSGAPISVTFSYVNIINGNSTTDGGGLLINGPGVTTLDHVSMMSNTVSGAFSGGGAIDNSTGTLVVNNSVIRANNVISGIRGGGIINFGLLILNFTSVESNSVRGDINSTAGGGIASNGGKGVVLNNSQVQSNTVVAKAGPAEALGGGLFVGGIGSPLTITNSLIRNNVSQAANASTSTAGGGIYLDNVSLKLVNSTISSNRALGGGGVAALGGGIYSTGSSSLSMEQLTMTGNRAKDGGGLNMFGGSGTISNSTFLANTAESGGGIQLKGFLQLAGSMFNNNTATAGDGGAVNNSGLLTVTNSTFTLNTATNNGGGISNESNLNKVSLASDTFSLNIADSDNAGGGDGGGIFNNASGGTVFLRNTLLSFNFRAGATLPSDCAGTLFSMGYNLVQDTSGCVIQNQNNEVFGMNPLLGLLQNNGGPTLTQALPAGSTAINRGDPGGCKNADGSPLLVDQRGFPRLGRCDIGAFEYMLRVFLPLVQR